MTFETFIGKKAPEHVEVLRFARQQILGLHPAMQETFKWGLPMYHLKKNIAYLDVQKGRPLVGVNYAIKHPMLRDLLVMADRKIIGHFYLDNFSEEKHGQLMTILDLALEVDRTH